MAQADTMTKSPPPSWRRQLFRGVRVLVIAYLGVILVFLLLERWLVYHPARAETDWVPPPSKLIENVELTTASGVKIHAWWLPGKTGAALYCCGNGGNLSYRGDSVMALHRELDVGVLIFDYPGYGRSEGSPSETGCYEAADTAYAWLRSKVPPDQIVLFGESLGGGVAVDLASRKPHRALILTKTYTSLPDVGQSLYPWLPVRWLMRNRFDSLSKIKGCTQPVVVCHGTADSLIPFEQGERLFAAANEPKLFVPIPGGDHNTPLPATFLPAVRRFLAEAESRSAATSAQPLAP
jgi:fermentation-respiration switch protein FrsA (DUF1100 family)